MRCGTRRKHGKRRSKNLRLYGFDLFGLSSTALWQAKRPFGCRKQARGKARADQLGLRGTAPDGHADSARLVIGGLVQDLGMTVKPTHARSVSGVEHEFDQNAAGRELRLESRVERIDPLPGDRRYQHRPTLR